MILRTKYFDLETDMFSFKNPEAIRKQLEEKYCNYFTDEPSNETITYNDQLKLHLKYKRTNDSTNIEFEFHNEELLFPMVGCIEGYKITDSDYSCRGYQYELNHTYSMEEDPVPCERGFHFCEELVDCFNYYLPYMSIDRTCITYDLDILKFLKVKSNGTTYKLIDKYCTNNITILEECTTEEILEAFTKLLRDRLQSDLKFKLRGDIYKYFEGELYKKLDQNM